MCYPVLLLLCSVIASVTCSADVISLLARPKPKICIGTSGTLSVPANRTTHFLNLRDRYQDCTYVDGNLELTWLEDESLDLSFLQHIREVTGYVLISYVSVPRLVLPSLQIIRGRTLFQINVRHEEFALMITMSPMTNLEMPALRDILAGSVGIFNNDNLCHIKTINWSEILTGPGAHDVYVYNTTARQRNCSACHESCPTGAGCWGPGPENCQRLSKINCSPQCHGGRCFGPEPRQCCHLFCAGGCTGPTQSDCLACRNFYDNGVCKQECPSMMQYDQTTYSWKPNPEGKYAYGATCVKECPAHLLKDNSACVRACPPNKMALKGKCVPCDGPCPKTCKLEGDHPIHSGNIDKLRNCTILQGSLKIQEHSFDGFQEIHSDYTFGPRHVMMPPSRLEVLSSLKEITGFVYIDAYDPQFRDLNFLRNLEVIGGRYRFDVYFALYIVKTSLESLRLHSLREISSGSVKIVENNRLCYAENIDWHKFVTRNKESNGNYHVVVGKNRNATLCSGDGMICDSQCGDDGCWGPGSNSCLSCKNFRAGGNCVQRCDPDLGMYQSSDSTCGSCDVQCDGSCTGAGPRRCVRCRNVRDGPVCLEQCPDTKYNSSGRCLPCHANCVDGCTGPENSVGPAACNSCHSALLDHNGHVEHCLSANQSCPAGFYREFVGPQLDGPLKALSGKGICRKCHPRCKNCTGYGFHVTVCQECVHYRTGEQCEDSCHGDFYADEVTHQCLPCSSECRGCHGPGNQCSACRNYRIYLDTNDGSSNASAFNCTAQCPPSHPHKVFPEGGEDPFCSSDPSSQHLQSGSSGGETLTIAVASAAALLLLLLAAGVICKCRLDKKKEDMLKMTMMMSKEGLNEPLKVTNVKPNLAKLRIIREVELRKGGILGYGAFGTVYKGVWVPEEEHVKIPVAIKVLREGTGADTNKEILEEAYLMASIEHVNLLPLLAVCMTSQLMLVTQLMPLGCLLEYVRKNRDKIGSKPLLNWGTQIARGMAYLEQHRLVHRDLAARNVLVQNPNLVRITDFGLAKVLDINEDEYKAAGGKMPIKWLALECIQHRIFTHKSDVWAFGVTVWELLTLGGRPYEDVHAKDVPDLLEKGERLPQPSCCSIELYMLMIKCWMLDAESRPAFADLAEEFAKMSRDPGRYLVIQGDKLMRLPSYTQQDERELMRSLAASALDSPADVLMDASEYLNPPGSSAGAVALSGYQRTASTASQHGYGAPASVRLHGDKRRAHSAASSTRGIDHYQSQDLGVLEDDCFEPAVYGGGAIYGRPVPGSSLLLQLPLDDDDYLMPSNGGSAAGYMDLVAERPAHGGVLGLDVDNPEYHIMSRRSQQQRPRPSPFTPPIPTPSYGYLDPCGGATSAHVACYSAASPNAVGVPVPPAHAHKSRPSQPNRTLSHEPGRNETTV